METKNKENGTNSLRAGENNSKSKEFKERWQKAKTWKDADNIIAGMTLEEMEELYNILRDANDWVGLTMKDEWLMKILKAKITYHNVATQEAKA